MGKKLIRASLQVVAELGNGPCKCLQRLLPEPDFRHRQVRINTMYRRWAVHTYDYAPQDSISIRHWFSSANVLGAGEECARI